MSSRIHSKSNSNISNRNAAAAANSRSDSQQQQQQQQQSRRSTSAAADNNNNNDDLADPLLLAFERGRVDEERRNLEEKSISIRTALHQDASDITMQQEDEKQKVDRLKSDYQIFKRKLQVVEAENLALVSQITESEESLEHTRRELMQTPGSPLRASSSPSSVSSPNTKKKNGADFNNSINNKSYEEERRDSDIDTALLAQLHVAEQRVSDLRGEHSALVEASTDISKRLREAATSRDALAAEVGTLRELDTRLKELNRNSATSEAEKLQKAHSKLVEALNNLKDRTTAAASERNFLATHLMEGAKERSLSIKEVLLRCAGGDKASQFLRDAVEENITLRRKSRQAMVDFMDEREWLQEYVLVLMARIAEATQRLHRDLYDAQIASSLKDSALQQSAVDFHSAKQENELRSSHQ